MSFKSCPAYKGTQYMYVRLRTYSDLVLFATTGRLLLLQVLRRHVAHRPPPVYVRSITLTYT